MGIMKTKGSGVFIADVEEVQTVVARKEEPWVTFPCAVSDADARVILIKKHSAGVSLAVSLNRFRKSTSLG